MPLYNLQYSISRKDRSNRCGGGCGNDKSKRLEMESLPNLSNVFERLWCKITTTNSLFYAPTTIYHPSDHTYNPDELVEFMYDSIAEYFNKLDSLLN